jgi:hypothetical protein
VLYIKEINFIDVRERGKQGKGLKLEELPR